MKFSRTDAENSGFSSNDAWGFEIEQRASGHWGLEIWGRFPPNWIGSFSSGLSQSGINVINGSAEKVKNGWQAQFEIVSTRRQIDLNKIDYLALAQMGLDATAPTDLALAGFELDHDLRKHGGALYLEVTAGDQLGFLGALVNRLAFYMLFPEEMKINTTDGKIFDRFWIKGMGGQAPSSAAINLLRQKLEGYLV